MSLSEIFALIQAISFVVTVVVAFKIYQMQKKDSEESGRRQARVSLTQAYCEFDSEILSSRDNIRLLRELFYPQYTDNQVQRIEFMFRILNMLYMEWHFYQDHTHLEEGFVTTLRSLMLPLAKSVQNAPENRFLIDDFEIIFVDYPEDFKKTVLDCINSAYNEPTEA
jgi:hypothetical protein